jgi:hypothetical protein
MSSALELERKLKRVEQLRRRERALRNAMRREVRAVRKGLAAQNAVYRSQALIRAGRGFWSGLFW